MLAELVDLEARGVCVTDPVRALSMLDDASAVVQTYTGQTFERGEITTKFWPTNGYLDIVGRDVVDVSAVDESEASVTLRQVGTYRWYAGSDRMLTVTYTAGWAAVPADIVAIVCSVAARALSIEPSQLGHTQDTAGPFSFTIGAAAAQGAVGLLSSEKEILDRYQRQGRAIRPASWAATV